MAGREVPPNPGWERGLGVRRAPSCPRPQLGPGAEPPLRLRAPGSALRSRPGPPGPLLAAAGGSGAGPAPRGAAGGERRTRLVSQRASRAGMSLLSSGVT